MKLRSADAKPVLADRHRTIDRDEELRKMVKALEIAIANARAIEKTNWENAQAYRLAQMDIPQHVATYAAKHSMTGRTAEKNAVKLTEIIKEMQTY